MNYATIVLIVGTIAGAGGYYVGVNGRQEEAKAAAAKIVSEQEWIDVWTSRATAAEVEVRFKQRRR